MATLSEYFDSQARAVLIRLERGLSQLPLPDTAELHSAARELRGTAHMAREDRMYRAVGAFEAVTRALAENVLTWSEEMAGHAHATIGDLRALLDRSVADSELDARVDAAVERWRDLGVPLPHRETGGAEGGPANREFREFAAREVEAITDALDAGIRQMAESPMDREPLKMILRRQRALLGAARLDETPVVAEILRAIEDLTRVIAKLDVGVKQEWLGIYRVAQEALRGTIEPLQRDENPQPSHALSRLRHMREELLDRYGAGEAVSAAHESEGLVQARPVAADADPADVPAGEVIDLAESDVVEADSEVMDLSDADIVDLAESDVIDLAESDVIDLSESDVIDLAESDVIDLPDDEVLDTPADGRADHESDVVPIESLEYTPAAALERALELRVVIDRVAAHDHAAREAVAELFDLIRLARD